jgi:EAL domain-containing protein (putative c-di-GMP-specific phosphodiesterase class I)/GGDEF domain-containing protein
MLKTREELRLQALHSLNLLDTPASEAFDRVTRMAAQLFKLPIAAVSLTDSDRQWFKSRVGVDHDRIPRAKAPCAEVAESADTLVIEDFASDARYCDSLLGANGIRFYAGAPLVTRDGYALGALCVLGTEPRKAEASEIAALRDMAAMVMDQIELQHAFGRVDPTTGLPNRMQFLDDLQDLAQERPEEERVAVILCLGTVQQIERYGRVLGPGYVDDMIREASSRLKDAAGGAERVYHVGPTQFALIAPPESGLDRYAADFAALVARTELTGGGRLAATVATGVAPFNTRQDAPREVLHRLLSSLHDARMSGSNHAVYSRSADDGYNRKFRMLHDFEAALAAPDQLRIVLQPRIDLRTLKVRGAEVLLRWNHPTLGAISPAEFVPVIEASPLVHRMTDWVLAAALDVLRDCKESLCLSVNVSATDLGRKSFAPRLLDELRRRGIPSHRLELEVTETAVMSENAVSVHNLEMLMAAGIAIAIDDFGTGYSSLSYLQRLPITTVKIDRSFIVDLARNRKDRALVTSLVGLSHQLGYRVVAEGIEDEAAAAILEEMGCEEGQGFYFSRPLERADFRAWLTARAAPVPEPA